MIPPKLRSGDTIRIIAPSTSGSIISQEIRRIAQERMRELGLNSTYSQHLDESGDNNSAAIASRVADIHAAFSDPAVRGVIAMIGGFSSNQLLAHLDYDLIKHNPKVFCGYSDITALQNAIYAKTGLVTYSGPAFSTFGMQKGCEEIVTHFRSCVMREGDIALAPSETWSDDTWYLDQEDRTFLPNQGCRVIKEGEATGTIIGGNLCTLNLLQGTPYMPSLKDAILFLEDDEESKQQTFDRDLQSLMHQPDFPLVRGIVIGRFQKKSEIDMERFAQGLRERLPDIPVIAGADFGHTTPMITFPIGGTARIVAHGAQAHITILDH